MSLFCVSDRNLCTLSSRIYLILPECFARVCTESPFHIDQTDKKIDKSYVVQFLNTSAICSFNSELVVAKKNRFISLETQH